MILNLLNNASHDFINEVGVCFFRVASVLLVSTFIGFSYYHIFPN